MNRPSIISLGEVLWDLFPSGERFGGAPANFACHAAVQGADVSMISAVGADRYGQQAIDVLRGYGVDASLVQIVAEAATGAVGIELDNHGKPSFTIDEDSAWDQIDWSDEFSTRIASADAVYFGTLGQRSEVSRATIQRAVRLAALANTPRVLDVNLRSPFFHADVIRESVHLASILKLSDEELDEACAALEIASESQPEAMLHRLLEAGGLDMIVMTRGANGAVLITADGALNQEGVTTEVIDTVGAGDAFMATFLIGELQEHPSSDNLRRACQVAAATCAHSGAVPVRNETESRKQP
jgi:fructokinase